MSRTFTPRRNSVMVKQHDQKDGHALLKEIGGDFSIEKRQVSFDRVDRTATPIGINTDGTPVFPVQRIPINSHVAVRSDTEEHLADRTVGDGYVILQNSEMVEIANAICGNRNMNYERMHLLQGGRGMAIQVSCPDLTKDLHVGTGQSGLNEARLTMVDWHDGTGSLRLYFSMLRLFCQNQLPAMGREFMSGIKGNRFGFYNIKHTDKMMNRITKAVEIINEAAGDLLNTAEVMRRLSKVKCSAASRAALYEAIANPEGKDEREMTGRGKTMYENRLEAIRKAADMDVNKVAGAGESWYEALQAVTYYSSHDQTVKGKDTVSDDEKRFVSANIGTGALTAMRGVELAVEMSGISL